MKHSYTIGCSCERCTREAARRAAQSAANPFPRHAPVKRTHKPRGERYASRAEQHSRYIDCGYQNWDDNGQGDY